MREKMDISRVMMRYSKNENSIATTKRLLVDKNIGRGAFANVYLCRVPCSRKRYAAKVVNVKGDIKLELETENEIEILKELKHHPNIVSIVNVIRDERNISIVLEYIGGSNFLDGIFNWPKFNEVSVKTIAVQLLKALTFCHSKRIVHRDISPDNIIWQIVPNTNNPNQTPLLKLIDFNLARKIPDDIDFLRSDPLGNPSYMAPECARDVAIVTFGSDIWSVGVLLFLLLGGYPPFWNKNYNHFLQNILEANYTFPQHLWSDVTDAGKEFLKKMLCEDYTGRLNAGEFLSHSWFGSLDIPKHDSRTNLNSPNRLQAFMMNLEEEKKGGRNRRYTLTIEERKPFIPCNEIVYQGSTKDLLSENKIVDKTRPLTCLW